MILRQLRGYVGSSSLEFKFGSYQFVCFILLEVKHLGPWPKEIVELTSCSDINLLYRSFSLSRNKKIN